MTGFSSKTCPNAAATVRAFRSVFGENCTVVSIREGDFAYGPEWVKQGDLHNGYTEKLGYGDEQAGRSRQS